MASVDGGSEIYGHHVVVMMLIVHLVLECRELRDARYYHDDEMVKRLLGLKHLPEVSTVSRALASADERSVEQVRAAWRRRTRTAVEWPGGEARRRRGLKPINKPIPKSTLYRWIEAFRRDGYLGLLPKPRADRGEPRRTETALWIGFAIGLLYEQPARSLTQLEVYLSLEFEDYQLSRTSLARHLRAHPAFAGIEKLRKGHKTKLRSLYEAQPSWLLSSSVRLAADMITGYAARR